MLTLKKQRHSSLAGFTLVEMMTALVINAILFTALMGVFIANINHYNKTINTSRLYQELEMSLQLMSNDIRRAGYWANAANDIGTGLNNNPYVVSGVDISVNGSNNCILLAYDKNSDGSLPAISSAYDDERYGFRLSGNAVQTRPPGATFSCTASSSAWENMTDPNVVKITALTFTLNTSTYSTGPGPAAITMRSVDISITGQLANDATITKTLTQHVRIRNDKYIP